VLDVLTPATNLALKNAQLAAVTRTRVAEVQASRRRVVAASDAERRRIERDLHDGAQQGLVSATLHMRLARGHMDEIPAELTKAETLVGEALTNLRKITHGLFPTVLTEEGLWVALQELVRASPVPASMVSDGDDDQVAPEVAMAAYATVAAVLGRSATPPPANSIHLTADRDDDLLEISIEVVGLRDLLESGDFIDNFDRVGAVGGKLSITNENHVTIVRAVLPCGS
jgi:signal transduction histidine kinase